MSLTRRALRYGQATVAMSRFQPLPAGAVEWHLCATGSTLAELEAAYQAAQDEWSIAPGSAVWRRIFTADWERSQAGLRGSSLAGSVADPVAWSLVEQPPLPAAGVSLWAYHISDADKRSVPAGLVVRRGARQHLWLNRLVDPRCEAGVGEQTRRVLSVCADALVQQGGRLGEHLVRTWVYLADIDADYRTMSEARGEFLAEHGLTPATHLVASTGIHGRLGPAGARIGLDAYAVVGVTGRKYLDAPQHLCRPTSYGASFERGVALDYGDRRQAYVSGTASIDAAGHVLFAGDVARQTGRALENLAALLADVGAGLGDLGQALVYLRDPSDYATAERIVGAALGSTPRLYLSARICRPEWLVEIEGIGLVDRGDPRLAAF